MAVDVGNVLRRALRELQGQRRHIDQQIAAIETALAGQGGRRRKAVRNVGGRRRRRRRLSAAARAAISAAQKRRWAAVRKQKSAKA